MRYVRLPEISTARSNPKEGFIASAGMTSNAGLMSTILPSAKFKKKRGAPAKADWPAYHEAFQKEVEKRGGPDPLNMKGWQRQADVERWLIGLAARDGVDISETTARTHARALLLGKGNN